LHEFIDVLTQYKHVRDGQNVYGSNVLGITNQSKSANVAPILTKTQSYSFIADNVFLHLVNGKASWDWSKAMSRTNAVPSLKLICSEDFIKLC